MAIFDWSKIKRLKPGSTAQADTNGFHEFPGSSPKAPINKWVKRGLIGFGILLAILLVGLAIPGFIIFGSAKRVQASALKLQEAVKAQNLDQMKKEFGQTKRDVSGLNNSLALLTWARIVPFLGNYVEDVQASGKAGAAGLEAGELLITTMEPYADILGFNGGAQAESGEKTAQERIDFIVKSIGSVVPELDKINAKTAVMEKELAKIDPGDYPEKFRGKPVRESIKKALDLVAEANELLSSGKPVLEKAPYLLGVDGERTYLFLFQNDKELRPTGGFLTAYSIIKVKDGKFSPASSNDIYSLDAKIKKKPPAPEPIKKYLPLVHNWFIRDMNLSPDFKTSMEQFKEYYDQTGSPKVDGIIAMDTKLVVDILSVIGRIGVPGFGNFSSEPDSRCNCPNVIYELESYADVAGPIIWANDLGGKIILRPPHSDNRKAILGPLMNSVLSNALGQPKEKLPDLFQAGFNAVREKHVLFYFEDEDKQKAVESFNIAGRVQESDGDYLHINDSNFAGAKSNLYVEQEVELKVDEGRDGTTNTLIIKYKNPQKHDGWLNGPYRDWFRVLVPKGSKLVDSSGSDDPIGTSEDLGKTVFDGFFMLRPEGVTEVKLVYKTPVKVGKDGYKLLIQKQPGTNMPLYTVKVGRQKEEFFLKTDKELKF